MYHNSIAFPVEALLIEVFQIQALENFAFRWIPLSFIMFSIQTFAGESKIPFIGAVLNI